MLFDGLNGRELSSLNGENLHNLVLDELICSPLFSLC